MKYRDFTLDQFQEEAVQAIQAGHSVMVAAPTGSGKTLIANYAIEFEREHHQRVVYTAPIKALSNQKYKEFVELFGEDQVGLVTGDISKNSQAPIVIMTTEIYRNMVMVKEKGIENIKYVIFDEIHYINDIERGYVWEESIIFSHKDVRFICLSATVPNAEEFAEWIASIKEHKVITITHDKRVVPLDKHFYDVDLGLTTLKKIKDVAKIPMYHERRRGKRTQMRFPTPHHLDVVRAVGNKVPCMYFSFSRKLCVDRAKQLAKKNPFGHNQEIASIVREHLSKFSSDALRMESTQIMRSTLPLQIGFHHSGVLPALKDLVEELFEKGLLKVLYTTETFAVGINMPAKTVVIGGIKKFDGRSLRFLNSKEFFQIAGRAGRRGIDKEGNVVTVIERRGFDYGRVRYFSSKDKEPIQSQFRLSVNTVLNMIHLHTEEEIEILLKQSFLTFQQQKEKVKNRFKRLVKKLERLNYVNNNEVTKKGEFARHIYADELLTTELFFSPALKQLDPRALLLVVMFICYEYRERQKIPKCQKTPHVKEVEKLLRKTDEAKRYESKQSILAYLATLSDACYDEQPFFSLMDQTQLEEGDLIRLYAQILDRTKQIRIASEEEELQHKLDFLIDKIRLFLHEVYPV